MKVLVNFLTFQLGWFSCVLAAAQGIQWLGLLVVLAVVMLHLRLSDHRAGEIKLIGYSLISGVLVESLLLASGWLSYASTFQLAVFPPFWIIAMWALFAITLNVSMRWLHGRLIFASLVGAIGGPLSYLAGERLGAMTLHEPFLAVAALSIAWSLALPLLILAASRIDTISRRQPSLYSPEELRTSANA